MTWSCLTKVEILVNFKLPTLTPFIMADQNEELTKKATEYHMLDGKPGKIETALTKPCESQEDLSLAYTPGVGMVCLEIDKNKEDVYKYTNKGNLVTVLSEGSAVLGLGDIGPEAGYPVMEGKGVLFKKFADVDVFPLSGQDQNGSGPGVGRHRAPSGFRIQLRGQRQKL